MNKHESDRLDRAMKRLFLQFRERVFLRSLSRYFLSISLVILLMSLLILRSEHAKEEAHLIAQEQAAAVLGADSLTRKMEVLIQDIRYAAALPALQDVLHAPPGISMKHLENDLRVFSEARQIYDQVRWIDERGRERVRIDLRNDHAAVVPRNELQDKSKRYYFLDAFKLAPGEVFVSPLDLNIERGAVEVPHKPMLRIATPVMDRSGRKRGIIILNYLGKDMLDSFERATLGRSGAALLLNREGHWLHSKDPGDAWGFMFGRTDTFATRHPNAWKRLLAEDSGQFETDEGLWTFSTVRPLAAELRSSEGSPHPASGGTEEIDRNGYFWKVVLLSSRPSLFSELTRQAVLPVVLLLCAAFAVSVRLAQARARQREGEAAIKRQIRFTEALFENAAIPMFVLTEGHRVFFWNKACEVLTGMPAQDVIGTSHHWKAFYTAQRPCLADLVLDGETGRIADHYERSHESPYFKNGWHAERWLELPGRRQKRFLLIDTAPIHDESGKIIAAVETLQDDTSRKTAADLIAASEWQFRTLFERSSDAIFLVDRTTGRYLDANKAGERLTGRSVTELTTLRTINVTTDARAEERLRRLASMQPTHTEEVGEVVYRQPDGSERTALLQAIALDGDLLFGIARDITEQRQAARELRESEERFRRLITSMDEGLALHEMLYDEAGNAVDYRFLEVNESFERLTGLKRGNVIGRTVKEIMPGTENYWIQTYARTVETGETIRYENYSREIGRYYGVMSYRPMPGQFAVIITDITERKRDEQLLQKRLELSVFAEEHNMNEVLQKALDLTEELTGSAIGFYHFIDEERQQIILQQWSERTVRDFCKAEGYGLHYPVDQGGVWSDCVRERNVIIHNDYASLPNKKGMPPGHAQVVRELVVPIFRKDRIVAILGVGNKKQDYTPQDVETVTFFADYAWDVAERKMAQDQLNETKQRLELATASAQMGVWDWSISEDRMVWNDRMLEIYGVTREQFTGTVESWKRAVHPDDLAKAVKAVESAFRGERPYDLEFRIVQPGGDIRHIKADGLVLRDEAGKPVRMIGLNRDITQQKLLEEQLQHSQKMEAVGTLAGGVAHDFNNILMAITGYGSMLEMNMQPDSQARQDVQEILAAAERATQITQRLLAFSRKQTTIRVNLDLNDLIRSLKGFLHRLIREDIEIITHYAEKPTTCSADTAQMEQLLINLVTNSRDAMPDGGKILLATDVVEVDRTRAQAQVCTMPGTYVMLSVRDTGLGIPRDIQQRVFDPFFTTKPTGKGTGLGLSLVYGIVQSHGGFIDLISAEGEGVDFRVYLPFTPTEPVQRIEQSEPTIRIGEGTVLLVEDYAPVRKSTRRLLESLGLAVIEAENGEEALRIFQEQRDRIDLVVTDVIMPRMNGRQLFEALRRIAPGLKVLFMSGYMNDVATVQELLDAGHAFIAKPVHPQKLRTHIERLLN